MRELVQWSNWRRIKLRKKNPRNKRFGKEEEWRREIKMEEMMKEGNGKREEKNVEGKRRLKSGKRKGKFKWKNDWVKAKGRLRKNESKKEIFGATWKWWRKIE